MFLQCLIVVVLIWFFALGINWVVTEMVPLGNVAVDSGRKNVGGGNGNDNGGEFENLKFNVNKDLECPKCASQLIGEVNSRILRLISHLQREFPEDPRTQRLASRYHPKNVSESTPNGGEDTSYTLNKGQKIAVCVRSGGEGHPLHDINIIMYVMTHEMGHLAVDTWGHGGDFPDAFKFLLREAARIGTWNPTNYSMSPQEYCGIRIDRTIRY